MDDFGELRDYIPLTIPVNCGNKRGTVTVYNPAHKNLTKKYLATIKKLIEKNKYEPNNISLKEAVMEYFGTKGIEIKNKKDIEILKEMEKSGLLKKVKII